MRFYTVLLLFAAIALSKSPGDSSTVCDRYQQSDLIFTGTAEHTWIDMVETRTAPIHKRSEKSRRVRFLSRDWFRGKRQNFVEVWMAPSDCPLRIEAGQTYLIYARVNKDKGRIETNACLGTVPVTAAASDISFLTAAQLGPEHATRISGNAGGTGLSVLAKSGINIRYALSGENGQFVFDGLPAGDWDISINGGVSKLVHLQPNTCVAPE